MKALYIPNFLLSLFLVSFSLNSQGQGGSTGSSDNIRRYYIEEGASVFNLNQDFGLSFTNVEFDDREIGDETYFGTSLNFGKAVSDKIIIGAGFQLDRNGFTDVSDFTQVNTRINGTLNLGYAFTFNDRQLIADAEVGLGQIKDKSESPGGTFESTVDLFSFKFELALPVQMYQSDLFLMPNIGYRFHSESDDGQDLNTGVVFAGLDLDVSVPNQGWWFDNDLNANRELRYTPGSQMWGYGTKFEISYGSANLKFTSGNEVSDNQFNVLARANYFYYPIDDFAIGLDARLNSLTNSSQNSDFKTTVTSLNFNPQVRWHPLKNGCWNDLYLEGGGGCQTDKFTSKNGSTNESKNNTWFFDGGVGTFVGLTEDLFLNPNISYIWSSSKDPDSDLELKLVEKGVQFNVELNYSF